VEESESHISVNIVDGGSLSDGIVDFFKPEPRKECDCSLCDDGKYVRRTTDKITLL